MSWTKIDQRRWEAVEALVRLKPDLFARQGTVQSAGRYFRLRYRENDAQRSIYLGPSRALAARVTALLDTLHAAEEERRLMKRLLRRARKGLRRRLAECDALLDRCGVPRRPFEMRDSELYGADLLDDVHDADVRGADAASSAPDQDP